MQGKQRLIIVYPPYHVTFDGYPPARQPTLKPDALHRRLDRICVDLTPITTQYSGVVFSPVAPAENWMYGDVINGAWNYPVYWCNGNVWASLEGAEAVGGAAGRIDFPNGANYVRVLVSGYTNVVVGAYDASGILIDSAGPTSYNLETSTMDQLTVKHNGIRYVLIHDTGQYWVIDDLCTDAAGDHPISIPAGNIHYRVPGSCAAHPENPGTLNFF